MKSNTTPSKETKITKTKIDKKVRKIWKKLKSLYIEYELSQLIKTNNDKKRLFDKYNFENRIQICLLFEKIV